MKSSLILLFILELRELIQVQKSISGLPKFTCLNNSNVSALFLPKFKACRKIPIAHSLLSNVVVTRAAEGFFPSPVGLEPIMTYMIF